jgi:hypothetical protein
MARYEEYLRQLGHKKWTVETVFVPFKNEIESLNAEISNKNKDKDKLLVIKNEVAERKRLAEVAEKKRQVELAKKKRLAEVEELRQRAELVLKKRREEQSRRWEDFGLCRYCGGKIGGLFSKKCKSCGKEK